MLFDPVGRSPIIVATMPRDYNTFMDEWKSTSTTARTQMISKQLLDRGLSDPRMLSAMNRVPREAFMSAEDRDLAYADRALPIACGQTISQPYIVGLMTEALQLKGDERVLEIGTGSGYQAAVLGELAQSVISVERHPALARQAASVLRESGYRNVRVVEGDGMQGWPSEAPFDRIIVTAATNVTPPALWQQLKEGGLMVIPLGEAGSQMLEQIRKRNGQPVVEHLCECRFVPLLPGHLLPTAK